MQLMSDAITVLGSRHGIFIEPCRRRAALVRGDLHPGRPCEIIAGIHVDGRTVVLPLTSEGDVFEFCDQDITPTSLKLTGIDPKTRLKLELTMTSPFKPRDAAFSTTPVLDLRLKLTRLPANFRWHIAAKGDFRGELFLEFKGDDFASMRSQGRELRWSLESTPTINRNTPEICRRVKQEDALLVHQGEVKGHGVSATFDTATRDSQEIHASWCVFSQPMLEIFGRMAPFKYTQQFRSLDDVTKWAAQNPAALAENAARVDGIFAGNTLSLSINNLMAQTLHSWMADTWWVMEDGKDWFSVWEGSCYYHSTVDVEYTQTPFYLTVWPELLGIELDIWPRYVTPGEEILGERGKGTVVFMHDVGQISDCDGTKYNHPMPVEENTNYILMSYAYWRRSGDFSRVQRHAEIIERALQFVLRCDTTGNGVPNEGMANTIDDASPAVQFGREQIYLAVKALAALEVGAEMLQAAGLKDHLSTYLRQAEKIRQVISQKGWQKDHFVTLLDPSPHGVVDAWSGKTFEGDELPGWDAAHIYTANGLALLDMLGRNVGMEEDRLRTDLIVATERCMEKFGCRHSDYIPDAEESSWGEGSSGRPTRVGWISMNMLRDISAFYRGVDLRHLADRYWSFQTLVNTQGPFLFFETFGGNNLMCYPRGVAIMGYFDALGGVRLDRVADKLEIRPMSDQLRLPILAMADWNAGTVPTIENGKLIQ